VGEDELNTLYYKRNGKWFSIATEALLDPEENYDIYSSPTKREHDPLNPLKYAGSPLSIPSSDEKDDTPRSVVVMSLPPGMRLTFTGEGGTRIKDFLRWVNSWYAMLGKDYDRSTLESRRRRVAQIHVSCLPQSVAANFINALDDDVFWDEEKLKDALVEQFHDGELDDLAKVDILSIMRDFQQGDRDVFWYSRKVLRLLRRKPARLQHHNDILIDYYIDGLTSRRLRDLAISSFCKASSRETPYKVVKSVIRLASQLKLKGYRSHGRKRDDDDDDDDDDDESSDTDNSDSDDESDSDDYYSRARNGRKSKRSERSKKGSSRREKRSKSKSRKGRKGDGDSVKEQVRRLSGMMENMMKIQQAAITPSAPVVPNRPEPNVIPLDTYAIGDNYGRLPPSVRYAYEQRNASQPTTRCSEYPNRRNPVPQAIKYNREYHGDDIPPFDGRRQRARRGGPANTDFYDSVRRPMESSHFVQNTSHMYEGNSASQPIVGPNGGLYYPARNPVVCYNCGEEGHVRPQCPKMRSQGPSYTSAGQDVLRPDIRRSDDILPPLPPPPPVRGSGQNVSVVEIAMKSSAHGGVMVREVTATMTEETVDLRQFVNCIEEVDKGNDLESDGIDESFEDDNDAVPVMAGERARSFNELPFEFDDQVLEYELDEEEEMFYDTVDDYYPNQIAENPEN